MKPPNRRRACSSTDGIAASLAVTSAAWLRRATRLLTDATVDAPRLCAELLLAHALDVDRAVLHRDPHRTLDAESLRRADALLVRRAAREPVQHLLGWTEFWSLRIRCDRRALVPRPETELCVQAALDALRGCVHPLLADIGTGTGCIALALAHEIPSAHVYATDLSDEALALARENAADHGLSARITLLRGDLAAPLFAARLAGRLDLVVCNPPYIAAAEIPQLQPEVRDYDPRAALDGGADGLDVFRRLFAEVGAALRLGGALIVEMGDAQADSVRALAAAHGWACRETRYDAAGIARVLTARRNDDGSV